MPTTPAAMEMRVLSLRISPAPACGASWAITAGQAASRSARDISRQRRHGRSAAWTDERPDNNALPVADDRQLRDVATSPRVTVGGIDRALADEDDEVG